MANHKSALKAARKAAVRTLRNKMWKSMVKTAVRKVRDAVTAGQAEQIPGLLQSAHRVIDKAYAKGIIHRNTAARKKSRLTRFAANRSA